MDNKIFPTFYHINDYNEPGYASLPRYLVTSYPLVLWAPSGRMVERCYRDNICHISPQQFLKFVADGYIHIIGRKWWFDKNHRLNYPWSEGIWLDGFDDRILAILREQEKGPEDERSVRVVEDERGRKWAKDYMGRKPEVISKVERLIGEEKVPQGVQEKASQYLEQNKSYEAVENVLRDLCNHVDAKKLAGAKVPFLSQKDADFFRLMESDGLIPEIKREMVITADMGRAIDQLADRLKYSERIVSLESFVGSPAHRELATWFNYAAEAANSVLPQAFDKILADQLREDALRGRFSDTVRDLIIQTASSSVLGTGDSTLIASLASEALDSTRIVGIGKNRIGAVYIRDGISQDVGIVDANSQQEQWAYAA